MSSSNHQRTRGRAVRVLLGVVIGVMAVAAAGVAVYRSQNRTLQPPLVPQAEPLKTPPRIIVSETALLLDDVKLLELPPLAEQPAQGAGTGAPVRRFDKSFAIAPLLSGLTRLKQDPTRDRERVTCTLAPRTPYLVLVEVIFTLGLAGYEHYGLTVGASEAGVAASLQFNTPAQRESPPGKPQLQAQVAHVSDLQVDFQVKGGVGGGCRLNTEGAAVLMREPGAHAAVLQCLRTLEAAHVMEKDHPLMLLASPETPASAILHAASAMRCGRPACTGTPAHELTRNLFFGVPHRRSEQP